MARFERRGSSNSSSRGRNFEEFRQSRGSGRGRDSGRSRGGRRDSGRPERTRVVCDSCGKDCEVPFKPTSSKPIYCDDCFSNGGSKGSSKGSGSDKVLDQINRKLDKILEALDIE